MKLALNSLWWRLTLTNVVINFLGVLLAALAIGPLVNQQYFREMVKPSHLHSLLAFEQKLLVGRLNDTVLAGSLLQAMQHRLQDVQAPQMYYGIVSSSEPRVSIALYGTDGWPVAKVEAVSLPTPARWLRSAQRLEIISDAERLLVIPLPQEGMLVIRHFAKFSIWKDMRTTLHDTGAWFWLLVLLVSVPGLTLGLGFTAWLVRRLARIARVAEAWAKGDLRQRIQDSSQDELGRHAAALNAMASKFEQHLKTEQSLATLQERQRLARELHDSVKQQVFATGLQLHAAQQWLARDPARSGELLQRALELNQSVYSDLSEMLLRLKPVATPQTLSQLLHTMLAPWAGQLAIQFSAEQELILPSAIAYEVARIVAEGAANAVRHGRATQFSVQITRHGDEIKVLASDNGQGFDTSIARPGMGLSSMRERAAQLPAGWLEIRSSATGTKLILGWQCAAEIAVQEE